MPIISPKSPANLARLQTLEEVQALKPEWLRIPAASRITGLSRSFIFEKITTGEIVSRHLKRPGKAKGIRLIQYASLMEFIDKFDA
jgi:hypothetical protein